MLKFVFPVTSQQINECNLEQRHAKRTEVLVIGDAELTYVELIMAWMMEIGIGVINLIILVFILRSRPILLIHK